MRAARRSPINRSLDRKARVPKDAASSGTGRAMAEAFAVNDRMNQMVIEGLDPRAWRAKPPGKARTIAAIFAHVHNTRRKWLRLSQPHLKLPAKLNRTRCTPKQAITALAESSARCCEMLADLDDDKKRIAKFRRDGWARPWIPGTAMFAYMITHEAHHRGQVCMLAHQLGHPLPKAYVLWTWEKLWKDCGFGEPR
jgi:uncharacterized damage-inducible protein DinB